MPKLSSHDIDYIERDLRARGLIDAGLQAELVDHVCCEVEELVAKGTPFKKAYEQVLQAIKNDDLGQLQNNVIQSDYYTTFMMLRNNFRIMLRNMAKYSTHTAINIGGLALGLICFIVLALYVKHEVTYDTQFQKSQSTYRITMSSIVGGTTNKIPTSYPTLGPALKERYADVQNYARIINYKYSRLVPTFQNGDNIFYEDNVIFADSTLFDIFDFPFLQGNATTALLHPTSVVITERVAQKYFGDEPALGKHLLFNANTDLEVSGVIKDIPSNTHLQFDFVIPMSAIGNSGVFRNIAILENWQIDWFWTYLVLSGDNAAAHIETELNKLATEKIPDYQKEYQAKFYVQKLTDIHLRSNFDYNTDITENGSLSNLYIFISVGLLVLFVSCINFINITIATASRRHKEIGISKVLGALRSQLRLQFLTESILICLLSLTIAFLSLFWVLPLFSDLLAVKLHLSIVNDFIFIAGVIVFTLLMGFLSGAYPAFFVSSFEPQRVLKGIWRPEKGGVNFRMLLVGIQIAISIFLIIGTMVIMQQLNFIRNKSLGFDKDQIVMLTVRGTSIPRNYWSLKQSLEQESSIVSVSSVSEPVGREVQFMSFKAEGSDNDQFFKILNVSHDFVKTMGLEVVKGRDFSREFVTDSTAGFLINEAAAKSLGWNDGVGKDFRHAFPGAPNGKVLGVVKDFNFEPLQKSIDPLVIFMGYPAWYVAVKVKPGNVPATLATIEKAWKKYEPAKPFGFQFLDQSIQKVYDKEERVSTVFFVFSVLSILTASLGLFGLVSFAAKQRLTEIGIRKVMGASIGNILKLMTREYLVLVSLAFVVAGPLTYLIMDQWLQGFAFRVSWNAVYFVIGLLLAMVIVIGTVVVRSLSAAQSNPVDVLRNE